MFGDILNTPKSFMWTHFMRICYFGLVFRLRYGLMAQERRGPARSHDIKRMIGVLLRFRKDGSPCTADGFDPRTPQGEIRAQPDLDAITSE